MTLGYFTGGEVKKSTLTLSIADAQKKELLKKTYSSDSPKYNISLTTTELDKIRQHLAPETEIKVTLTAEDGYGQKDEVVWDMLYTARPFVAVIEIDKDSYPEGETVQLLVKVVDIDKQPAAGIPLILEADGGQVKKEATTDDMGIGVFEFLMPAYAVNALIKSPVMKPVLGERYIPFEALKPMHSKVTDLPKDAGTKTKITVHFDPGYIPIENVIHVDLTDISGALVASTTIQVHTSQDRAMAEGEITAPTWGSMLVNLYCCAVKKGTAPPYSVETAGFITEGQHVTFYPDKELEIIVKNFKPRAAPGEKMDITINVKGGEGEKALGVAVVDDAVISLLDPFIKAPTTHFYNPQAKVIATGGSGVLTWPVVDRNWGYPWRDIAYTNWGWKDAGPFVSFTGSEDDEMDMAMPLTAGEEEENGDGMYKEKSKDDISGIDLDAEPVYEEEYDEEYMAEEEPKTTNGDENKRDKKNGDKDKQHSTTIIIRTEFPETAFWEPRLVTKNGKATVQVTLPEEITTQRLSILASDKHGFISLLQKEIQVTKPVFIRADFPPSLTKGDTITARALVRNLTDASFTCTASLSSPDITVVGEKDVRITLDAGESAPAEWKIQGGKCGLNTYTVSVDTKGKRFTDAEKKTLYVLPQGEPEIRVVKESIKKNNAFTTSMHIDPGADFYTGFLTISLPTVFPAFQAWHAFEIYPWYSPWAIAATAIMNSALLEYVQSSQQGTEAASMLMERLGYAGMALSSTQFQSGAWGWYPYSRNEENNTSTSTQSASLYYTLSCLRGLLDIKRAGLPVSDPVIEKAIYYILGEQQQNGLWVSKSAYFWDVYNDQTDYALSAEIFEIITMAMTLIEDPYQFESGVREIKERMTKVLSSGAEEPMTVACILAGLMYWKEFSNDASVDSLLKEGISHLIALKRRGYWEPHWYHAYGGMVELNARILTLLATYEPDAYASYLREGVTWLLSTREAWGAWHNEIGTAHAVRALLKTGVFGKEVKSEITIQVNGKNEFTATIDPADPFLSAAKLHYVEITEFLQPGDNSVRVTYNGNLTASVILEEKVWGKADMETPDVVRVKKSMAPNGAVGQPIKVTLSLGSEKIRNIILIEEPVPSQCIPDKKSLDALVRDQKIIDYSIQGDLLILSMIYHRGNPEITYRLTPLRKGTGVVRSTRVLDPADGKLLGISVSSSLVVQ